MSTVSILCSSLRDLERIVLFLGENATPHAHGRLSADLSSCSGGELAVHKFFSFHGLVRYKKVVFHPATEVVYLLMNENVACEKLALPMITYNFSWHENKASVF